MKKSPSRLVSSFPFVAAVALLTACLGQEAFGVGASTPFTTIEAESGTVAGGATVVTFSGTPGFVMSPELEASGRSYVKLTGTGQSVTWTNNTGQSVTAINVRASVPPAPNRTTSTATGSPNTFTLDLYVNGTFRQAITLTSKQTWLYEPNSYGFYWSPVPTQADPNPHVFWDEAHFFVTGAAIAPGSTFALKRDSSNTASFYYLDCVDVENPPAALTQPSNSLSITSYGAVANNSSVDNTTAIQNCISAAKTAGKAAWVPSGTFYLTSNIDASNVVLEGAGMWYSGLYFNPSGGVHLSTGSTSGTVQNLYIGSSAPGGGGGVQTTGFSPSGSNWVLNSVWIEHHGEGAVWGGGTNGLIENCRFNNTYGDGVNLNNVDNEGGNVGNDLTVENNHIRGTTDDGIAINSSTSNNMQSPMLINNTVCAPAWANCIGIYGGINDLVQDNYCADGVQEKGINVGVFGSEQPLVSGIVTGNTVIRCGSYISNEGISVGGTSSTGAIVCSDVFVGMNTVINSFFNGITVGSGGSNVVLESNVVENPTLSGILLGTGAIGNYVFLDNSVSGVVPGQSAFVNNSSPGNLTLTTPINATSYNTFSGIATGTSVENMPYVKNITNGCYTGYNAIDLNGATEFIARAASGGLGGNINIHAGSPTGTLLGTVAVPITGGNGGSNNGWENWVDVHCPLTGASGVQPVYLVFTGGTGGSLFNLEWFGFVEPYVNYPAANFTSQNGGVATESCSEGGLNLKNITNGCWTSYANVNLNGAQICYVRVASAGLGGNINICLDSPTGTQIGSATVPVTGGWETWTTVNCSLTGASGTHTLYLNYVGGTGNSLFNVEWFAFSLPLPYGLTEAATYNTISSGLSLETCSEGGQNLKNLTNGSFSSYSAVDLTGYTGFKARVASGASGGTIQVCLDSPTGTVIGTATVSPTGGWESWTTVNCAISATTGFHNVYLVYNGGSGFTLFNVEWFSFSNL